MRQISTLLLTAGLATSAAAYYPTHGNLLYSADISTGEARYFDKITVEGDFEKEKILDFGYVWRVKAGRFLTVNFTLPEVEFENCQLRVTEKGMSLDLSKTNLTFLRINSGPLQTLKVIQSNLVETNQRDLDQSLLQVGANQLEIVGFQHDLAIQRFEIQCQYPLPTIQGENEQSITLLSPRINQHLDRHQPLTIEWGSNRLPDHSLLDLDYLDTAKKWQTIAKGLAYNHPTGVGSRGFYLWNALPDDVNPQLQVRISYDPEQAKPEETWTDKLTGMAFTYIPPGCFKMGSPETEVGRDKIEPQTHLCVDGFWMGQTEVTNAQYEFMENHNSGEGFNEANQPVVKISRLQAEQFANWLSKKTGKNFRLPTEAEWVYAARAGNAGTYYWNENESACNYANIADVTWRSKKNKTKSEVCQDDSVLTAPVATFKSNAFGLYDMIGNVAEWVCSDMPFDSSYAQANTCEAGFAPLIRGGSFQDFGNDIRLAKRSWWYQDKSREDLGFRLIRVVSDRD